MTIAELRTESDLKILEMMALRATNETVAEAAFQVFYERYEKFVSGITFRVCKDYPGSSHELVQAVINNTFLKIYERASTFDPSKVRKADMTAGIKAWLGTIADNEYKQLLRQAEKHPMLRLVEDVAIFEDGELPDTEDQEEGPVSYERDLLDQALATLSERERYILVQSAAHEKEGHNLPTEFLENTCKLYNITKLYFRKIKSTALQKVKDKIIHLQALSN
jgi:RNA polymerase sigma factor (sigma-70 family)